jgi:sugar transferase (PEP-CTERM/EpsH1 system associated)
MNILFACHRFPFPPNRGGKIRPFHMIQRLSQRHSVTVASVAHTPQELADGAGLKQYCDAILAEVIPNPKRWTQTLAALPGNTPSSVAYFHSASLQKRVSDAFRASRFDLAVVHCAFAAQYIAGVNGVPRVLDFGDLDSGKWFDYSVHRWFPLSFGYLMEARKLRRYETELAAQFNRVTLTTKGEEVEFQTLGVPVSTEVIPNGVNTSYFQARKTQPLESRVLAFLGRMDYYPNIDGVLYFIQDVFPLVRRCIPSAELRIIGSNPSRAIRKLASIPGVTVTGHVPDVRTYLEDAALGVVPLRLARGTQNKILELMAAGIPVVTTATAAKGIQAVAGRDLLVADQPAQFAQQVLDVLEQPELRSRLAAAGARQVAAAHAWEPSMARFEEILTNVAAAHGRP